MSDGFTESTLSYWQALTDRVPDRYSPEPPFRYGYPVRLPCGCYLVLPLRRLPDGVHAVASLIANQASSSVITALCGHMADQARDLGAELVVGLPTLGLVFAAQVAERLEHGRYVPLGYSRKFWYDDALSEAVASITSPEAGKRLRIDPNLLPLLKTRRVVLVDDAISTGTTAIAACRLLRRLGVEIAGIVVAMRQTNRWEEAMPAFDPALPVRGVYDCPLFRLGEDGWWPIADTMPMR